MELSRATNNVTSIETLSILSICRLVHHLSIHGTEGFIGQALLSLLLR